VESVDAESEVAVEATEEEVVVVETEKKEPEDKEEEDVVVVEDEPDKIAILEKKIEEMQKELGSKRAPVDAFNAEEEITQLIRAGHALPKMKASLLKVAENPEAFQLLVASLPKMVSMETKAKLAKIEKQTKKADKPKTWDEEYGESAKKYFRI
jgi:molecular chaperone GrpE (heat shock protein)